VQIYKDIPYTGIQYPTTSNFLVYPNPAIDSEIHIILENGQEQTLQIEIFTLSGQKVQTEILNVNGSKATFTRKNLSTGIYLMKINGKNWSETVKLIVQ
jgi:hypothetical protein